MDPIMMELVWEVINEAAAVVPPAPPGAAYPGTMVCHQEIEAGCAHPGEMVCNPETEAGCAYIGGITAGLDMF